MFKKLGAVVSRHWVVVLLAWAALVVGVHWVAPDWWRVTLDGDFEYLPARLTSVRGAEVLKRAFPEEQAKSSVVLIVARPDGPLGEADFAVADLLVREFTPKEGQQLPVLGILSYQSEILGRKLISRAGPNGQAVLTIVDLRAEFMAIDNMPVVKSIYQKVDAIRHGLTGQATDAERRQFASLEDAVDAIRERGDFSAGLQLAVTGSASIGADMLFSAEESIQHTEFWTVALVIMILLLVYRAPGLVVVPLVTIGTSVVLAKDLVALLAQFHIDHPWFDFKVFKTTEIFIVVILFGAGTDFCLFLIARYREELRRAMEPAAAIAYSLGQVGHALAASAMTTILGLGTMIFADFGKSRNGGPAIALCLAVALAACVTLAPALLRAAGRWVFWPFGTGRAAALPSGISESDSQQEPVEDTFMGRFWDRLSRAIVARPGLILVVSLVVLAPLAYKGTEIPVSYDLVNELSRACPSVQGVALLQRYFPPGETGPVTVLACRKEGSFDTPDGRARIARLTKYLYSFRDTTAAGQQIRSILSVRSLTEPLGDVPGTFNPFSTSGREKLAVLKNPQVKALYLAQSGSLANRVTRLDLILPFDPFSRESIALFNDIEKEFIKLSAQEPGAPPLPGYPAGRSGEWAGIEFDFVGTTPGIRDLKEVTTSDRRLIERLVVLSVLAVLIVILRSPVVCVYLILSVLFSYFITIGSINLFFAWLYGTSFHGLDWKVPLFLFVILIAIGQDYNIYLVTRVFEEQERYGPLEGLRRALARTGGIITSCGVIMAGTFVSMTTGTLRGMIELGVALSFGIMLDTLVIRTMLVPAFLALWERRRLARAAQSAALADARRPLPAEPARSQPEAS